MALARLECKEKDGLTALIGRMVVCLIVSGGRSDCARWYCPLEMNSESLPVMNPKTTLRSGHLSS